MKIIVSLILALIFAVSLPAHALATEIYVGNSSIVLKTADLSNPTGPSNPTDPEETDPNNSTELPQKPSKAPPIDPATDPSEPEQTGEASVLGRIAIDESGAFRVELKGTDYIEESIGEATLDGKELNLETLEAYASSEHTTRAYILVDISSPMRQDSEDIKAAMELYIDSMGEDDEVVFITFGAKVSDSVSFRGDEKEEAKDWVDALTWDQQFTFLYEAMRKAYKEYTESNSADIDREFVLLFSDCEDDETGKPPVGYYNTIPQKIKDYYDNRNLPLYVAFFPRTNADVCQERFNELAVASGGALINFADENGSERLLERVQDVTLVTLTASGKITNSGTAEFGIEVNEELFKATIPVDGHINDSVNPTVKSIEYNAEVNVFQITFSEEVMHADLGVNYSITGPDGKAVMVEGVRRTGDHTVFEVQLKGTVINGTYKWEFNGITDASLEENPVENENLTYEVTNAEDPTSPTDTTGDSDEEEGLSAAVIIAAVVMVVVLVVVLVAVIIAASSRKKQEDEGEEIPVRKAAVPQEVLEHTPNAAPVVKHHIKPNESARIRLRVITGKNLDQNIELDLASCVIVGRSTTCDIYIDDTKLSRQHFAIEKENSDLYLTDLQSRNGTMLNGVRVDGRRKLNSGDKIVAGLSDITITVIGR